MAFLLFPSKNYRAIWISKSSRAAGLIEAVPCWRKEGACAQRTPPALSSCAVRGDAGEPHPGWDLRDVCTQPGLGESWGWFLVLSGWKGRERRM